MESSGYGASSSDSAEYSLQEARATIAVIDDEPAVRLVARSILQLAGFRVLDAADGLRAIELFKQHGSVIDVVLLDVIMPVMDGAEVLGRIRQDGFNKPVVVCSGYSEKQAADRFHGLSFHGFLQKPFTSSGLLDAVRGALRAQTI